jgi:hypothetical protein
MNHLETCRLVWVIGTQSIFDVGIINLIKYSFFIIYNVNSIFVRFHNLGDFLGRVRMFDKFFGFPFFRCQEFRKWKYFMFGNLGRVRRPVERFLNCYFGVFSLIYLLIFLWFYSKIYILDVGSYFISIGIIELRCS